MSNRLSRVAGLLAPLILLPVGLGLAGCSEDDPFASYCEEVEVQQEPITEALARGDQTGLIEALPSFEALAAKAPDDIEDEWAVVTRRITVLADALEEAGVDAADYDRKNPPEGLTEKQKAGIDAAGRELGSAGMQQALTGVQQQARDVCQTPLSL